MYWGSPKPLKSSFLVPPEARRVGDVDPNSPVRLIAVLRSAKGAEPFVGFVVACGLAANPLGAEGTRFELIGTYAGVKRAFRPEGLGLYKQMRKHETRLFVGRSGCISLPAQCLPYVLAIMGIDQRQCGRPATGGALPNANGFYRPREIATRYDFPTSWDGSGQTVGVIALGGGYLEDELSAYLKAQGVHWTGSIQHVTADGTVSDPELDSMDPDHNDAVFEVQMDVSVIAAVAPGAQIVVYFGAARQPNGLYRALDKAIHDDVHMPSVISVSWEFAQRNISSATLTAFDALLAQAHQRHITVCVASGDHGALASPASAQPDVAFPACSQYVLSCGGTALDVKGVESAWGSYTNVGSGGGYSKLPMPSYQQEVIKPGMGRGVPDVAGMAVPGYDSIAKDRWHGRAFNGTSAVAPLWAAFMALINQGRRGHAGMQVGFVNETLYQHRDTAFIDIQSGSNTAFQAERGWDELTGLGAPRGSEILRLF